jgi:hypothetical protein
MSYLSDLDARFTDISERVLKRGFHSALSNHLAEIIHHYERRLTNPTMLLDENNLIPLTAEEHSLLHDGKIRILKSASGYHCIDRNGARFKLKLDTFKAAWREEVMRGR